MKTFRFGLALSLALVLAPGCGSDTSGPANKKVDSGGVTDAGVSETRNLKIEAEWNAHYTSKHDDGGTLVIGSIGDADTLNPIMSSTRSGSDVQGLLFMQLTRTNYDFSHAPGLAKDWEFSEDHMELTFHLRDDVFWHDGVKTTAHDVKFTYHKQIDPAVAWSAIKWKEHIKDVVVVDDHTIKYVFKKRYLYQLMDAVVGYILPKHILEKVPVAEWKTHEFGRKPVGNGPYKIKEWKAQESIEIVANEKFHLGRPPLDRIIWKILPDQDALVLHLKSGDIDFMESVPPEYHRTLDKESHLVPYSYPSRAYSYIGWNMKNPLFESVKVRTAMTHAINRQDVIDGVMFGKGKVATGPIMPFLWAYNPDLPTFDYDPEKAKQLLAEEGWKDTDGDGWLDKDGKPFAFSIKTNKGNKIREDIAVLVQEDLKKIGVKVTPNIMEWTIFSDDLNKKNFEAAIAGWSVGLKMDMTTLWHSSSVNDKFNFVSFQNKRFDELNDKAKFELDIPKARKMWQEAQELIVKAQPYTFLYIPHSTNYLHKRFRGIKMYTVGWAYNVEQWWVPKDQQRN